MSRAAGLLLPAWILLILLAPILASPSSPAQSWYPTFTPTSWYYVPLAGRNWPWKADKVIVVIWDGTQRAHLLEMLADGELPYLEDLLAGDAALQLPYVDSETCEPGSGDGYRTETCPGNSAISTGLGYPGMANWTNADPHPIPDGLTLWEWFKGRGYATGMVCAKDVQYWPNVPLSNAQPEIDYWLAGGSRSWVTAMALEFIRDYSNSPFFLWVHYREPDYEGHSYGENHVEYSQALTRVDGDLGILLTELGVRGIAENTLLVVTTDHGFVEGGFGHGVCDSDTKDLFLVSSPRVSGFDGCVEAQTDIAGCLKGVASE
jgi:hypothetical protein